jgi:hypothetical protein
MLTRYIPQAAAISLLSLLGSAFNPALAQATPPAAPAVAEPANQPPPRSIMLQSPAANGAQKSDGDPDPEIQELDGVTVKGKRDALSDSDKRMRDLVSKLPCTGCDIKGKKLEEHRSFGERAAMFVAEQCCIPTRPPEETEANELDRQLTQQIINPTNNHP